MITDFETIEKIGDGAYSQVYKVKRLEDSQEYAMKKVKLDHLSEKEREMVAKHKEEIKRLSEWEKESKIKITELENDCIK